MTDYSVQFRAIFGSDGFRSVNTLETALKAFEEEYGMKFSKTASERHSITSLYYSKVCFACVNRPRKKYRPTMSSHPCESAMIISASWIAPFTRVMYQSMMGFREKILQKFIPSSALNVSKVFLDLIAMEIIERSYMDRVLSRRTSISHWWKSICLAMFTTGEKTRIDGTNKDLLLLACDHFLGKSERQICDIARQTLEGHQRSIVGGMTVEEIYQDRTTFSQAVFDVAKSDLINMGISIVSFTIKDISDEEGYLKSLGMSRTARVKCEARCGEAEARRDAGISEAEAEQLQISGKLTNEIEVAKSKRDFEVQNAEYECEVKTQKACSDLAYELQGAKTRQKIKEEEMQVLVLERNQQIQVEELENVRTERHLDATVRKPAEAECYRLQKLAEAERIQAIAEAEAEAEAIKLKGLAEAEALRAVAAAEAEQMREKAEAFEAYGDAATIQLMLQPIPKILSEIGSQIAKCDKITMLSSGNEQLGPAKMTGEVLTIMEQILTTVRSVTGVELDQAGRSKMKL